MSDDKEVSTPVKAIETALAARNPFKELLKMAADFIRKGEIDKLYNIDVMLTDRFIEYLRNGTFDDLDTFLYDVLSFTDSSIGDRLKENPEGKRYFYRWEHFHDLCDAAIEGYDPQLIKRLIEARKLGKELMNLLYLNEDGIRHNELSQKLGISPQYLSKLLKEFQEHDLITRERNNKVSIIKLSLTGRAYMKENENHLSRQKDEHAAIKTNDYIQYPLLTPGQASIIAERKREYMPIPVGYSRPVEFFFGPGE